VDRLFAMSLPFARAVLASLLLPLPLFAAPVQPGEQFVHKDWMAVCDNSFACSAIALAPDGVTDAPQIVIERGSGEEAVTVRIRIDAPQPGEYRIRVGRRIIASGAIASGEWPIRIEGETALTLARAIGRGQTITIDDGKGKLLGKRTLDGSAAALRHIDATQNRARTRQALFATGKRTLTPRIAALPAIVARRIGKQAPVPDAGTIVGVIDGSKCTDEPMAVTENSAISLGRADGKRKVLVLISCGSGAYNMSFAPYVGTSNDGRKWAFAPARFDYPDKPDEAMDGVTLLSNVDWDAPTQQLNAFHKGRGLGDCGRTQRYVWDGEMFRLLELRAMDECRGSIEWPVIWRASVEYRD